MESKNNDPKTKNTLLSNMPLLKRYTKKNRSVNQARPRLIWTHWSRLNDWSKPTCNWSNWVCGRFRWHRASYSLQSGIVLNRLIARSQALGLLEIVDTLRSIPQSVVHVPQIEIHRSTVNILRQNQFVFLNGQSVISAIVCSISLLEQVCWCLRKSKNGNNKK